MTKFARLFLAVAVLCPTTVFAQITVSQPSGTTNLKAAEDFATHAFQDPWDMSQKTDVGPFLGSKDAGSSNWAPGFTFTGGLFSGTTTTSDAQLWFLDTGNPNAAALGKIGTNFPINADFYKVFAVKMTLQHAGSQAQVLTWPQTIYTSSPTAHFGATTTLAGSGIYFINLTSATWTGLQRALRFQPTGLTNEGVTVDWARLVPTNDGCQQIKWAGVGDADIYIDTNGVASDGNYALGQAFASQTNTSATRASAGCPVVANAFNFYVGVLPAGSYRVFVVPVGTNPNVAAANQYAPGTWVVNDAPTLKFTAPSDEGSDDDFATSQLGDAWDMDKVADVDTLINVTTPSVGVLNTEAPDGSSLPGQRVFIGASAFAPGGCAAAAGDPQMWLLDMNKRGKNTLIDTNRYRLLTVEFGIPNAARDVNCGSVARVIWRQKGDLGSGSVSDDIIFNQRAGVNLLDKFTVDLKTMFVEQGTAAGGTNWTNGAGGGVELFRFDPHEFDQATVFYVKRVKLADYERAKTQYTIRWNYSKGSGTVDLFYDTDGAGFNGLPIQAGIDATLGQFNWTNIPANLQQPGGNPVFIYAVFSDPGGNSNQVYAPQPILIDSNFTQKPRLVLSRRALNVGVLGGTSTTSDPQTVRLTFVGPGTPPCWAISNDNGNFTIAPATGTGNATVTVSMVPQTFPGGGAGVATFTVTECPGHVATILNPGQRFTATFRIASGGAPPIGGVDTPANGATVVGSMGVTGWAVDDIGITGVWVYRSPAPGEPADGLGRVFIGNATRVDDARPDIEGLNPAKPFNYRGGWGYLALTNFFPNQGNGTFVISVYATDKDGHETFLGSKTITANNTASTEPFGAIDTPQQGETVNGTINNFGWVLVQGLARADPLHGGRVQVVVDGAVIGSPAGWAARGDIQALFPKAQYSGVDNALGVLTFNTAVFQDGVHTISWNVFATNGQAAGIGSRFFSTVNGNSLTLNDTSSNVVSAAAPVNPFANLGRQTRDVARLDMASQVHATTGYSARSASLAIASDATGLRTVYGSARSRVVVDASTPGTHRYEAYLVADGTLRPLPIGSSFDDTRGVLAWQPMLGFNGSYDFLVVRDGQARIPVRVVLTPDSSRAPAGRLVRGIFAVGN